MTTGTSREVEAVRQRSTGIIGWPVAARIPARTPFARRRRRHRLTCGTGITRRAV